ncbi:MAG TPA: serine hydrolase [Syntrophobacteraceae bacterium]|nr:serine hydrolase [Syntrophobacteraceae bacterium]
MMESFELKSGPSPSEIKVAVGTRVKKLFHEALALRVFSGASILVAGVGGVCFESCYGRISFASEAPRVTAETWFDLASLTKPLVTASLSMAAVSRGWLDLDAPLNDLLRNHSVPLDKAPITLRQLLNHCSGLPAYRPYYRRLMEATPAVRRETLVSWVLQEPMLGSPESVAAYSDLGFMLIAEILEQCLAMPLDVAAVKLLFEPLGIRDLRFQTTAPLGTSADEGGDEAAMVVTRFVRTELCLWRRRQLAGEVHDENAYALGGVAGHAGLFGNTRGVYRWLNFLWDVHEERTSSPWFSPEVVQDFWRRQELVAGSTWALGFDTPSSEDSSAGARFSPHSVGHLGFTGTSFWLDLDHEIMIILLTNRVHANRDKAAIKAFRPQIHNAIMETLYAG